MYNDHDNNMSQSSDINKSLLTRQHELDQPKEFNKVPKQGQC